MESHCGVFCVCFLLSTMSSRSLHVVMWDRASCSAECSYNVNMNSLTVSVCPSPHPVLRRRHACPDGVPGEAYQVFVLRQALAPPGPSQMVPRLRPVVRTDGGVPGHLSGLCLPHPCQDMQEMKVQLPDRPDQLGPGQGSVTPTSIPCQVASEACHVTTSQLYARSHCCPSLLVVSLHPCQPSVPELSCDFGTAQKHRLVKYVTPQRMPELLLAVSVISDSPEAPKELPPLGYEGE
jgi:hypothetical protein